jgi:hypothetical protein
VTVRDPDDSTIFHFLHVMKTGGTSLFHHISENFAPEQIDPPLGLELINQRTRTG